MRATAGGFELGPRALFSAIWILESGVWILDSGGSTKLKSTFGTIHTNDTWRAVEQLMLSHPTCPWPSWYYSYASIITTVINYRGLLPRKVNAAITPDSRLPTSWQACPRRSPRRCVVVWLCSSPSLLDLFSSSATCPSYPVSSSRSSLNLLFCERFICHSLTAAVLLLQL